MIRKFLEIENLGIFDDFHWNETLPRFERLNIVYGWNGSGKTTLSRFFLMLNGNEFIEFQDMQYRIETDEGNYEKGMSYIKKIRVFNQDYISKNIDVLSCTANPIFILGEENKKIADLIRKDELLLRGDSNDPKNLGMLKELEILKKELDQQKEKYGKLFTDVAKIIGANILGTSTRDYRKNNAEKDFSRLNSKNILTKEEKTKLLESLRQQELGIINEIDATHIGGKAEHLISEVKELLSLTIQAGDIEKLKNNSEISKWVEDGVKLHQKFESTICEYCNQEIPLERILQLNNYFNDADKKLKLKIDAEIAKLELFKNQIDQILIKDEANLYKEFRDEYVSNVNDLEKCKREIITDINRVINVTENKKLHTNESIDLLENIDSATFETAIQNVNFTISKHNQKSKNFSEILEKARETLKNHYLSEIFDDVKILKKEIEITEQKISLLEEGDSNSLESPGINEIQRRIEINRNKISESGLACDEINSCLETFLGRKELVFENGQDGYVIKRNGLLATNLSEGEKTAIAFVYFTIHIKDKDFNVEDGIVVIDDPISSFDSNSLFQAFSFLKNSVQKGYQIFILTHNFDFLQLIINWFNNDPAKKSFYMIKNEIVDGKRCAHLDLLDKLLCKYHNEYQYLFSLLVNFKSDGTIESVYNMPNITRKVLDNFLDIMVPDNSTPYKKLAKIDFDDKKKTAIYKFTNDQSHITGKGFDPSLLSETQKVIAYLLEMMEKVFPMHYKILQESLIQNNGK